MIICIILSSSGCGNKESRITKLSMLEGGKTFAVPTGTVADKFVLQKFPDAKIKYFNTVLDCALAVKEGKADAAVYDKPVLKNIAAKNDGLTVLSELLLDDKYGFAVQLENKELKTTIDGVLAELKANGTYDDMMKRWFPEKGKPAPMPEIELNSTDGILKFGTSAVTEPMSFVDGNQKVVGFDIEFASYVAKKLNKKLEIIDMEFGAMLPALIAGKVDLIGAGLSITEERAKKVLFSESYYPSGIAALVRGDKKMEQVAAGLKLKTIEDVPNSIESIDKGQNEAGIASGFTKIQTFIYIIMPQAMRHVLPVYKGEFISLVKMTSIVGYIAVQDLTKASDIIRSRTFDAFFPLLMAAFLYIIIAGLLTWALSYLEISVDPKRKRIKKEVEVSI